jgi:hypothetical protein
MRSQLASPETGLVQNAVAVGDGRMPGFAGAALSAIPLFFIRAVGAVRRGS